MNKFIRKLTSRKFISALIGFVVGIALVFNGNIKEGATTITASVISYLASEGIIDFAAVLKEVNKE